MTVHPRSGAERRVAGISCGSCDVAADEQMPGTDPEGHGEGAARSWLKLRAAAGRFSAKVLRQIDALQLLFPCLQLLKQVLWRVRTISRFVRHCLAVIPLFSITYRRKRDSPPQNPRSGQFQPARSVHPQGRTQMSFRKICCGGCQRVTATLARVKHCSGSISATDAPFPSPPWSRSSPKNWALETRTLSLGVGQSQGEVSFGDRKSAMRNDTQHGNR